MKKSAGPECADILRALGDKTRLAVLQALLEGPAHVGELMSSLQVEQSLLSHHLKVLRDAGLVSATRQGKAVLYQLAPGIAIAQRKECLDLECCQIVFKPASPKKSR